MVEYALRICSLERIVHRVERLCSSRRTLARPESYDLACELVVKFQQLRPYFPRDYNCLFDCLALLRLLGHRHVFPHWIFGVQLAPFAAHCWLQLGNAVLNDRAEYVNAFTPIMVV